MVGKIILDDMCKDCEQAVLIISDNRSYKSNSTTEIKYYLHCQNEVLCSKIRKHCMEKLKEETK